jgi:hypothetical protein
VSIETRRVTLNIMNKLLRTADMGDPPARGYCREQIEPKSKKSAYDECYTGFREFNELPEIHFSRQIKFILCLFTYLLRN